MKTRNLLGLSISALVLASGVAGVSAVQSAVEANGKAAAANTRKAAKAADEARHFLAKRQGGKAVTAAEAAVSLDPQNAEYRALLGQTYLLDGRFVSASQALNDALTLDPANGKAALNLALAKIGAGDWSGARSALETHAGQIPAADLGLAYALAGDTQKAVDLLGKAVREPEASAKTRQNLALALALDGKWQEAKSVASVDLPPDQVDARIMEWAKFSRPANAYDQVAALLGVQPVQDAGQPVQLALNDRGGGVAALVQNAPTTPASQIDAYMPGHSGAPVEANTRVGGAAPQVAAVEPPAPAAAPAPVAAPQPVAAPALASVTFAPRQEVVQALPVSYRGAKVAHAQPVQTAEKLPPAKMATAVAAKAPASAPFSKGQFVVQLGAYANVGIAKDAWARVGHRTPSLAQHAPQTASVTTKSGTFYRLSVGGFSRGSAESLCSEVRTHGGNCFVRATAGDKLASWSKGNTQLASR